MQVAFLLSVVALVAGQPTYFPQVPPPYRNGVCSFVKGPQAECCMPLAIHRHGCDRMPGIPWNPFRPGPPTRPGFPPAQAPPQFLMQVCCAVGEQCCMTDQQNLFQPTYTCCPANTHTCNYTDGMGECQETLFNDEFPYFFQLDNYGRCPEDGAMPMAANAGRVYRCSLDPDVLQLGGSGAICPAGAYCAKDNSANQEEGVCCYDSTCQYADTCTECVTGTGSFNTGVDEIVMDRPCSWLSQGDVLSRQPRCIRQCADYPDNSCILAHPTAYLCPRSIDNPNGTNYNTGNCQRRCGLVGTGRSSGINMDGNEPCIAVEGNPCLEPNFYDNATVCCDAIRGDFCCNNYGQLADHCSFGRLPGGPMCGVPISGQPQNFFNTAPYQMPNSAWQWETNPAAPRPRPPMFGMPPPPPFFGGGFYGGPPGFYGGGFSPFMNPFMYRNYGEFSSEDDMNKAAEGLAVESDKQYFYPGAAFSNYRPMPPPPPGPIRPPPPPLSDQQPSAFTCSCDSLCSSLKYADCCDDYFTLCDPNYNPSLLDPTANIPDWWVDFEVIDFD